MVTLPDLTSFQSLERKAYNGMALVVLRSAYQGTGKVVLTVKAKGLPKQKVVLSLY